MPNVRASDPAEPASDPAEPASDPAEPASDPAEPASEAEEPTEAEEPIEAAADAVLTASRVLVAVAARSLGETEADVSIQQYRTLVVLAARGPQRPIDIAAALGVGPSTVTRLCDRLADKDLISRLRNSPDRREVHLALTKAGEKLLQSVTARRRTEILSIVRKLSASQRLALVEALGRFSSAAGEVSDSEWPRSWEL